MEAPTPLHERGCKSMEEVRKVEGLAVEELEAQTVELLPDREEMQTRSFNRNLAVAAAFSGSAAAANAGSVNKTVINEPG